MDRRFLIASVSNCLFIFSVILFVVVDAFLYLKWILVSKPNETDGQFFLYIYRFLNVVCCRSD